MNRDFIGTFFDPYYSGQLWKGLSGMMRDFGNYMTGNIVTLFGVFLLTIALWGICSIIEKK